MEVVDDPGYYDGYHEQYHGSYSPNTRVLPIEPVQQYRDDEEVEVAGDVPTDN